MAKRKSGPNPIDIHVGNRVRERRTMLGISQTKLGDAIGVTFQQVQKNEKGANRIGSSRLQQIAEVLKVPVTYFFEGAPGEVKTDSNAGDLIAKFMATPDCLALAKAFSKIKNRKLRRGLVRVVKELADDA